MTTNNASKFHSRPHLATAALAAFGFSFIVARTFTTFFPSAVIFQSGVHIHHFWYGILLLAVGGWIGISYNDKETDLIAAVLYGAGGGLIVDEVGLLLTFGNYWSNLSYTVLTIVLVFAAVLLIINRYRKTIKTELFDFLRNRISLYLAVFLLAVSVAFTTETNNFALTATAIVIAAISIIFVVFHGIQRLKKNAKRDQNYALFTDEAKPAKF